MKKIEKNKPFIKEFLCILDDEEKKTSYAEQDEIISVAISDIANQDLYHVMGTLPEVCNFLEKTFSFTYKNFLLNMCEAESVLSSKEYDKLDKALDYEDIYYSEEEECFCVLSMNKKLTKSELIKFIDEYIL